MKKIVCLALVLFMALSLAACPNTSSDNASHSSSLTTSETKTENSSSSKQETPSGSKKPSSTTSLNNHKHQYEKTQKLASCGQEGGDVYTCDCGDSYIENRVAPSYKHDFQQENRSIGEKYFTVYKCTQCDIEALYVEEWWKYKVKFDEVRWYVTGKINRAEDGKSHYESDYEIVVCGKGDIEDFNEKTGNAPWRSFLGSKLKSITVAGGITSIGKNAFNYRTSRKRDVTFYVAGSVKTIKSGAINLNIYDIVLGDGVEVIEQGGITGISNIYLPKSVKTYCDLGLKKDISYYYEGDIDGLLKIQVENPGVVGNQTCTFKESCDYYFANTKYPGWFNTVILNSPKIRKGTALFDGKQVKTDADSIEPYINK